jgi:hypothetical protein
MSDWWNQPTEPAVEAEATTGEPLSVCPWCAHPAVPDAPNCTNCGAAMAQHEDLGGLLVPGVTGVDPAMQATARTSLIGAQASMSTLSMLSGTPGGMAVQLVAAAAMLVTSRKGGSGSGQPEDVGKPSQAALDMAQRMRQSAAPSDGLEQPANPTSDSEASQEH